MKKIESYTAHKQTGILLNANEVSNNVSDEIRQEIKNMIDTVDFNRYPDDTYSDLLEAYSNYIHVPANQILCGNGSDQMLDLIMSYYLSKGKTLYTIDPDFGMYDYYATKFDAKVLKFKCEEDGSFDIDAFIQYGKENHVDMVIFSNPNNPSGHYLKNEDVLKIVEAFKDIPFVDDEAYIEFADESMMEYIGKYPNFYITRTLSKIFGMAAIRTGFLIGSKENMEQLYKIKVPYALNTLSQQVAMIALGHIDEVMDRVKPIVKNREMILSYPYQDIKAFDSQANFIMLKASQLDVLKQMFEDENIVIRTYQNKDYIRITIGNDEQSKKVFELLKEYDRKVAYERSIVR